MKNIVILGATGSIGTQALEVIKQCEDLNLLAVSGFSNVERLRDIITEYKPKYAVSIQDNFDVNFPDTKLLYGEEGLCQIASLSEADIVLTSIVGSAGLIPTMAAIREGKTIALANKETLVTAGEIVMSAARKYGAKIIPVDSEHSAIYQCLNGEHHQNISKLILTASGGSFRDLTKEEIRNKKAFDALKHPNWSMGRKITIDSATLMNKGLEFIEAMWLFNVSPDDIDILVHYESIIHSMVEFVDGSVIAQLGQSDMRLPISYALNEGRVKLPYPRFDFTKNFTFSKPDFDRFPCLDLAIQSAKMGGNSSCILNAANEVLVSSYLDNQIGFYDISDIVEKLLFSEPNYNITSVEDVIKLDYEIRIKTVELISKIMKSKA